MKQDTLELKKSKILTEASKMIEREGYDRLKVAALAKEASVSISTIYALFESKEGIYLAYIESKIGQLFNAIEVHTAENAFERLEHYTAIVCGMAEQGRTVLKQGVQNNPLFFTSMSNEFKERARELYDFLAECFLEMNPSMDMQQAYRLGYAFNGQLHGYLQYWAGQGGDLGALADELCETFFCQVANSPEKAGHLDDKKGGDR